MFGWIRVAATLTLVLAVTVPLALAQIVVMRTGLGSDRVLPRLWHRFILRILDFRLTVHGRMATERPLMLASNHISWTDIMVAGAAADINFVAKSEVSGWPMIGTLAHLQRTIFVERGKRGKSGEQAGEIARRMAAGDPMMVFAEGVTADGNLMLPFKSTLFGAARYAIESGAESVAVQPVAIVYTRLHGMPMQRQHRSHVAWIGDRMLAPHIIALLKEGGVDVALHFGEPVVFRAGDGRKEMAREVQRRAEAMFAAALRDTRNPRSRR